MNNFVAGEEQEKCEKECKAVFSGARRLDAFGQKEPEQELYEAYNQKNEPMEIAQESCAKPSNEVQHNFEGRTVKIFDKASLFDEEFEDDVENGVLNDECQGYSEGFSPKESLVEPVKPEELQRVSLEESKAKLESKAGSGDDCSTEEEFKAKLEPKAGSGGGCSTKIKINREAGHPTERIEQMIQAIDEMNQHPLNSIREMGVKVLSFAIDRIQKRQFKKFVKKGQVIHSKDFEFIKLGNQIMVHQYSGKEMNVIIPATVGKLPVCYLHPDFLFSSINPLATHKIRAMTGIVKSMDMEKINMQTLSSVSSGVTSVSLPETLMMLADNTFVGCKELKELIVPASVISMKSGALKGSGVQDVYFNGDLPPGFEIEKFSGRVWVRG